MNVSIGGIFIRSRRLSNTLLLLELVSSIFVVARWRDPQLVVDVMRRFSINNPRRMISFPFEDETLVQGVSRKEWLFLTGFIDEMWAGPEFLSGSPDLRVICKFAGELPRRAPPGMLCRLPRRMFAGGQAVSEA